MSELALTPERKKLQELGVDDLKAISVALLGLVEDDEISRETRDQKNATRLFIAEWLKGRETPPSLEGAQSLSIPSFYLDPAQVVRVRDLEDLDDFPVLEPDDLTYVDKETGVSMHRRNWQTSFFALSVRTMGIQHTAHLHVQPAHSKWAHTSGEKINLYTSAWDSNGHFSPHMAGQVTDFIEVLTTYAEELEGKPS